MYGLDPYQDIRSIVASETQKDLLVSVAGQKFTHADRFHHSRIDGSVFELSYPAIEMAPELDSFPSI